MHIFTWVESNRGFRVLKGPAGPDLRGGLHRDRGVLAPCPPLEHGAFLPS